MVLGHEFFKGDVDPKSGTVVPIAFPLIAGSGTLTTIISLRANYSEVPVLIAILMGSILLKEGDLRRRLFWGAVILVGMGLLATG